ncbi:MAG: hypothetical protein JW717_09560 [Marinilabiliaceae bacterium]|nr:hypothetical protein [Marinilabiliaceae bacterium]
MINEILELVKVNNRVIIPNFGAFIISKEGGYSVLFNNFLSFNDGLLVNHISAKKSIDAVNALKEVNEFVESLKKELDETGEFKLDGLGKFTKDSNGIMRFHQAEDVASVFSDSLITKKEEPKDLLDIDSSLGNDKKNFNNDDKPLNVPIPGSLKKDKLLQIDQDEKTDKSKPVEKGHPVIIKKEPVKKTDTTKAAVSVTQPQAEKSNQKVQIENNGNRNKRSIILFALLFILLPVIGFTVYYFLFKEKEVVTEKVPIVVTVSEPEVDTTAHIIVDEPVDEAEITYENRYQIIAGTFSSEKAANEYVLILKGKGFNEAFVMPRYGKYLVSIDSEKDLISAEALQEKIVNTYRIENYIITLK